MIWRLCFVHVYIILSKQFLPKRSTDTHFLITDDLNKRLVSGGDKSGSKVEHFVSVWGHVAFQSGLQPIPGRWLLLPPYSPSLNPIQELFSSFHGGEMFITTSHMIQCPYLTQWMLEVWTCLQGIAKDGSGMKKDSFPVVLQERT